MDLKLYFHKVRTTEATIPGEHTVVVSLETSDGGREGRLSEVARAVAAKLIVQGKVRLANEEETKQFQAHGLSARMTAEELLSKDRLQLSVLHQTDIDLIRSALKRKQ